MDSAFAEDRIKCIGGIIMPIERSQVKKEYIWDIEDIFETVEDWNRTYDDVLHAISFSRFQGKLGSKEGFLAYCKADEKVIYDFERLSVYAFMKHDEDARDSEAASLMARVNDLGVKYSSEVAFVVPELTSLDEEVLK